MILQKIRFLDPICLALKLELGFLVFKEEKNFRYFCKKNIMQGKLIIFAAPSGSGKTTIVKHLLALGMNLSFSVSATTRPKRENEHHGKDYFFLTQEEFKQQINAGAFLEWEEVYEGTYYGSLKTEVDKELQEIGRASCRERV